MHLNTDELVDLAEGTRSEASAPHLAGCEQCRAQMNDLRAMMSATAEVAVPEPSPLFWDHLSQRVHDAVAVDARLKPSRSFAGEMLAALTALLGARAFRLRSLESDASVGETRRSAIGAKAVQASAVVAAGLLIAVMVNSRAPAPAPVAAPAVASVGEGGASVALLQDVAADDASLTLVASLTADLDLDEAREAGLAPRGSAEHAVTHMSDGELRELGRILKEELSHEM